MWRAAAVAVTALCATAHADTRAWTAAEKVLPAGLEYVVAGRGTHVRDAMKLVHADVLDELHTTCHVDPQRAVDSFAVGVRDDGRGVVVVTLAGEAGAHLEACLKQASKRVSVRWLDDHTLAFATEPGNPDLLAAMTSGGLAKDAELTGAIRKVSHAHALWGAARIHTTIEELGATVSTAYGTIDLARDDLAAEVHLVLDSRVAAVGAALKATTALALVKQSGQVPAQLQALVGSLIVVSHGDELVVTGRVPARDLGVLLAKYAGD
jgi:hypothetical protein